MKTIYLLISLAFLTFSCETKKPQVVEEVIENMTEQQIDSLIKERGLTYDEPIILGNSEYIMIPISFEKSQNKRSKIKMYDSYGGDYAVGKSWNILFYNRKTDETRLLSDKKISIEDFNYRFNNLGESKPMIENTIFYEIIETDLNEDGELNYKYDPSGLFVSDYFGNNLLRLTPEMEKLMYYKVIPKHKEVIAKTLRDIDENYVYDFEDQYIWYKIALNDANTWERKKIISDSLDQKIKNQFLEQWVVSKAQEN